ncbi:MAG: UDP-N-acetylglucosamine 1-carboxyvinyltransferase [Patescibacteria group bacterium]|nr:UDP-N-acetylglucosamine 1-carboxyvinyltransferase [Patescibacteria group bacterium]
MSKFVIEGGKALSGEVVVSGSKNAALPILASSLLTSGEVVINNVPDIQDIRTMIDILESLGVKAKSFKDNKLVLDTTGVDGRDPDFIKVKKIRASVLTLGPLLARFGSVKLTHPGGCHIGARPIDTHLKAFEAMGATVRSDDQFYYIEGKNLKPKKIVLDEMSVTATENAVMAAALTPGITEIRLAAGEPHVQNLMEVLNQMGAKIKGIGTHNLVIEGVKKLEGTEVNIIPDPIEAGTWAVAAAVMHGDVTIKGFVTDHQDLVLNKLREANVSFKIISEDTLRISRTTQLQAIDIKTNIYPGFPTDLQAPFTLLLTQAKGTSRVHETMFEGRLNYIKELVKMGANAKLLNSREAVIFGPSPLFGKEIESLDLRSGATLILAALTAEGTSTITNAEMIDRGYENIEEKLKKLGASIKRIEEKVPA